MSSTEKFNLPPNASGGNVPSKVGADLLKVSQDTHSQLTQTAKQISAVDLKHLQLFQKLESSYKKMVDFLTNIDDEYAFLNRIEKSQIPSESEIMDAVKQLSPKQLEILGSFVTPIICILSPDCFEGVEGVTLDEGDLYSGEYPSDEFWGPFPKQTTVTIVEGATVVPAIDESFICNPGNIDFNLGYYEGKFAQQGLKVMTAPEGMVLQALAEKEGEPMDDLYNTGTLTYYSRDHLPKDSDVPFGYWDSENCESVYYAGSCFDSDAGFRCRPSFTLMII